jgi:hypothetical protein
MPETQTELFKDNAATDHTSLRGAVLASWARQNDERRLRRLEAEYYDRQVEAGNEFRPDGAPVK